MARAQYDRGTSPEQKVADKPEEQERPAEAPAAALPAKVAGLPDVYQGGADDESLAEHSGLGNEEVRIDDAATPFMTILQSNSPQCMAAHEKRIPGAEAGMFYHTLYKQWFRGPLLLVDCFFEPLLIEWTPRGAGGGLVKIYPGDDPIEKKAVRVETQEGKKVDRLPNGNDLVKTAQHYFLWLHPEKQVWEGVAAGLSSTQLTHSRALNALLLNEKVLDKKSGRLVQAPRFSRFISAQTGIERRDQNAWFGWVFNLGPRITAPVVPEAVGFAKLLAQGKRRSKPDEEVIDPRPGEASPAQDARPRSGTLADDMPM